MKVCSLGIVGPGIIWDFAHSRALQEVGSFFRIEAFCATSEKSRRKVAGTYPGKPFFFDYGELLKEPKVDGVVIMTPIPLNASYTIQALEAGKHVFVEKPMATSGSDAARIIAAEKASKRRVFVLEQVRYKSIWRKVEGLLASGTIGRPVYFDLLTHSLIDADAHDVGGAGKREWRIQADFPLGTLFDGGIHAVAEITGLFGPPASVYALGADCREGFGEYDHVVMSLTFSGGLNGTFSHSGFLGGNRNYFYIRGTQGLLHIEAPNTATGRITIEPKIESQESRKRVIEVPAEFPHTNMWLHFQDCLEGDSSPDYTAENAGRDIRVLEAAAESLAGGSKVDMG